MFLHFYNKLIVIAEISTPTMPEQPHDIIKYNRKYKKQSCGRESACFVNPWEDTNLSSGQWAW